MNLKRMARLTPLILVFHVALCAAMPDPAPTSDCPSRVNVLVESINPQTFREFKRFSVTFVAEIVSVRTKEAGLITDIKVSDGDRVSRGFILVMLNEGLEEEKAKIRSELEHWEKILWQREHWKERNAVAEEQARRRVEELQARLEAFSTRDFPGEGAVETAVAAPMAGTVELQVVPGTEVEVGDIVARVINRRRKLAHLNIPAPDRDLFPPGNVINLEGGFQAVVSGNDPDGVRLTVEDPADRLKEGPHIVTLLKREVPGAVVLPADRILRDDKGSFVYVAKGKQAKRTDIAVAVEADGRVLVSEGLEAGDLIITHQVLSYRSGETTASLHCLEDGKRIRLMATDPETGLIVYFKGDS